MADKYIPSDNIIKLRNSALEHPENPNYHWQRNYYYMQGWMGNAGKPLSLRISSSFANIIRNMPVFIADDDVLAGAHGNSWCENMNCHFTDESIAVMRQSALTDSQKDEMEAWMRSQPFAFIADPPCDPSTGPEYQLAHERGVIQVWGTLHNHSIRDYEKMLRLGFSGIKQEVEAVLESLDMGSVDAPIKRANLLGWIEICDAGIELGKRHADTARRMAEQCECPDRAKELRELADICDNVPANPARTFKEAVQSLWFAHCVTVWEDGVNANGIGRIDQFLWPYLERELSTGVTTRQEAMDTLSALWIKMYQPYDVQQMMVGGQLADGSDAVNPLSYMVLDVTEALDFVRCLSARLHKNSPQEFAARCVDLIAKGGGIPFFFNDEALIPALVGRGIPLEEARGYAAIGCIEITIPGKALPHAVSNWINVAKCLELAINDGKDIVDGRQVGIQTGYLADFETIDDVWKALQAQFEHFAQMAVYGSNACELNQKADYRLPYLSLLTSDCIAKGYDITQGGARFNYHSSAAVGIPNAADSLTALKTAVFDENWISSGDMLDTLKRDFADSEELRARLQAKVPKYGNDQDTPDYYAAELTRLYCDTLGGYKTPSGGTYFSHLFTFTLMLPLGVVTGASADGRKAGMPLAYSMSPGQGRDREGLTAVINSLAKIPHHLAAASSSAILELDPALLNSIGRKAFTDLLMTAIKRGVGQLQFNVVSADILKAAQADPDRYRSLCVRVSGFSQQFCLLDKEMQNHIIARTKHRV